MKKLILFSFIFLITYSVYSQDITNTLGTDGEFIIKDGSSTFFTLYQTNGHIKLPYSLGSTIGSIFKGTDRFLHTYAPSGADGYNTFLGFNAGNFTMSGTGTNSSYNTGIGFSSLSSNSTGYENTAVGDYSLSTNSSGYHNTAIGHQSLYLNSSGYENTAVGCFSMRHNTTGNNNTAVGFQSLWSNTTGYENTAIGFQSLRLNNGGYDNTAIGYQSLLSNTSGYENTAIGFQSLISNTTGYDNTAVGFLSLYHNTSGYVNTSLGVQSLFSNTSGHRNVAIGSNSLLSNTEGCNNTALGYYSLHHNTTGDSNTAVGSFSLRSNTTGNFNTAVGYYSLFSNDAGDSNTALGFWAGHNITSGYNITCIGNNSQPSSGTVNNEITLGNQFVSSLRCNVTTITSLSDARDKKNISNLSLGLDFIIKLKPRQFNWDRREWYEDNKSDGSKMEEDLTAGFIAQELDEVQQLEDAEWLDLVYKSNPEKLETTPGNLLPVMVKAIQELKAENDELKEKLTKFEKTQNILFNEIEKLNSKDGVVTKNKISNDN